MLYFMRRCLPRLLAAAVLAAFSTAARAQERTPILILNPGGHTSTVHQVLFTSSGNELISVGDDKVIRVWSTGTGKEIGTINGQIGDGKVGKLYAAALSSDGKTLAVAGNTYDGDANGNPSGGGVFIRIIHLGNLHSQPLQATQSLLPSSDQVKAHQNTIFALAFSPTDPNLIASGGADHTVRVWNVQTGKSLLSPDDLNQDDLDTNLIDGLAWSPDGKLVASASLDNSVRVWDVERHKLVKNLDCSHPARSVAWSADGKTLAAGDSAGEIHLFDPGSGSVEGSIHQDQSVSSLAFSPDGRLLAAGQEGTAHSVFPVTIWAMPSHTVVNTFRQNDANVTSIAFSPDGATLASAGGSNNDIFLWGAGSGEVKQHLAGSGGATSDVAWSPDGSVLKWTTDNGKQTHYYLVAQGAVVDQNSQDQWVAAVTSKNDLSLTQSTLAVTVHRDGQSVSFPPDPADNDFSAKHDFIQCYGLTPDGSGVVVGSRYHLALYSAADGHLISKFVGHTDYIKAISVSPDGKYLASASNDQTVAVWPLAVGGDAIKPLMQLFAGANGQYVVWNPEYGYYTCSPDGERIIGWQVNNGQGYLADYAPASSFAGHNQRPVIQSLLTTGSALAAIQAAGKPVIKVEQTAPIVTVSPVEGETVSSDHAAVTIKITTRAGNDLDHVTVSVNSHIRLRRTFTGPNADSRDFTRDGEGWTGSVTIPVRSGPNIVSALASGADGTESADARVTITSTAPVSHALPSLNVLAIGVAHYLRFPWLDWTVADAKSIADAFASQEGKVFKHVDVHLLTEKDATQKGIEAALSDLSDRGKSFGDDDITIVFIAGHGGDVDAKSYYFLPYDTDTTTSDSVKETAVPWSKVDDTLQDLPGNVILMLDACHSAGKGGGTDEAYESILTNISHRINNDTLPIITLASCRAYETSQENAKWQHGAFTKAILDGLAGGAVGHGGTVTAVDLRDFVNQEVKALTNHQQSPTDFGFINNSQDDLALAKPGAPAATAAVPSQIALK